jgi:hypothetical protein
MVGLAGRTQCLDTRGHQMVMCVFVCGSLFGLWVLVCELSMSAGVGLG